jgi:hypothetical protein
LPAKHFHVVFTLPSELRRLAKAFPRAIFDALMREASQTLLDLGHSRLGATLGITMVLHTWTRQLDFHPHVHALVTAGGLRIDDEQWKSSNEKYLFPITAMRDVFRAKMLAALDGLHAAGKFAAFSNFQDPQAFDHLMRQLAAKTWVVYAKKPFRAVDTVLRYLGRYTHRVAIANSRLVKVTDTAVSFRTKEGKVTTLQPLEFLRRFIQHVLPDRFHKIRHFGLYAASDLKLKLEIARRQLSATRPLQPSLIAKLGATSPLDHLRELTGRDVSRCPVCLTALTSIPLPNQRAPPSCNDVANP